MADTRPTPVSFWRGARLCASLLLTPDAFIDEEKQDAIARNNYKDDHEAPHPAHVVRRAFVAAASLVAASGASGFIAGNVMGSMSRCAPAETVAWLQIAGACTLLWGTLFIRGWEVQTYSGVSLTERVNQWLYRALYCVGTSMLVYSLSFPACRP